MNIALASLAVFLIVVPGFAFRARYRRVERTTLDFAPLGDAVISGVVFAGILHLLWLSVPWALGYRVDIADFMHLLGADAAPQSAAIDHIAAHARGISFYCGTMLLAAYFGAPLVRRLAEHFRWHIPGHALYRVFGFDAPWYYLLRVQAMERGADVLLAAVVDFGGHPFVIRGLVVDYYLRTDGELDRVVLEMVDRRPLEEDRDAAESAEESRYYQIEGDFFVLWASEAITLNVQYVEITLDEPGEALPGEASPPQAKPAVAAEGSEGGRAASS